MHLTSLLCFQILSYQIYFEVDFCLKKGIAREVREDPVFVVTFFEPVCPETDAEVQIAVLCLY